MKQSLQRIAAWAKKHPLLALVIVGGVILLGYLVYKKSGGRGGGGGETFDEAAPSPGGDNAIPNLGDIASPITSGGGTSIPSSEVGTNVETGQPVPVSIPQLSPIPAMSAQEMSIGSGWSPPSVEETVTSSFQQAVPKEEPAAPREVKRAKAVQTGFYSATGKPVKAPTPKEASGLGTAKGRKVTSATASRGSRTPAERLGLYWLYTGVYNNIRYVGGFPVGIAISPAVVGGVAGSSIAARSRGNKKK